MISPACLCNIAFELLNSSLLFISASYGCASWLPHSLRACRRRSGGCILHRLVRILRPVFPLHWLRTAFARRISRNLRRSVFSARCMGHLRRHTLSACHFKTLFHRTGIVHIVTDGFFYLPFAFRSIDRFGGALGDVACTIELCALATVPQFVE